MKRLIRRGNPAGGIETFFDERPIRLEGFELRARSAVPLGRPKFDQLVKAIEFTHAAAESSPYWLGDLMRYAENREDWADRLEQALNITGLARHTIINYASICKRVEEPERRLAPSVKHADIVAKLPRPEQTKWLEKASTEGWTALDLRKELRAAHRSAIIDGQATLEGMYRIIYADPPWLYNDSGPTIDGSLGKAERHYPGMTIEQLCALPVAAHALPDSLLAMWVTAPLLLQNPGPREVLEAWGFTYKTNAVWDKVLGNFGHYFHVQHEHLIICTRGSCMPDVPTPQTKSIIVSRRSDVHSEKPAHVRKVIEKHWTRGPYLELFGRERVPGWTVFGNDARLWAKSAGSEMVAV